MLAKIEKTGSAASFQVVGQRQSCEMVRMKRSKAKWCCTLLAGMAMLNGVSAQIRASQVFEDWLVTCQTAGTAKSCAMSQTLTEASSTQIALVWIIEMNADGRAKAIVRTPLGVLLPEGVHVSIGNGGQTDVPFRFCGANSCTAEFVFGEDWLSRVRSASAITVDFMSLAGQPVSLGLSLKGFRAAYEYISVP
jgi:invasion protein IalB